MLHQRLPLFLIQLSSRSILGTVGLCTCLVEFVAAVWARAPFDVLSKGRMCLTGLRSAIRNGENLDFLVIK